MRDKEMKMSWFDRNFIWISVGFVFVVLILFNISINMMPTDSEKCIEQNPKTKVLDVIGFSAGGFGRAPIYKYQTEMGTVMSHQEVDIGENVTIGCYG